MRTHEICLIGYFINLGFSNFHSTSVLRVIHIKAVEIMLKPVGNEVLTICLVMRQFKEYVEPLELTILW